MSSGPLGGGSVLLGGVSGFLDFAPAFLGMPRSGVITAEMMDTAIKRKGEVPRGLVPFMN